MLFYCLWTLSFLATTKIPNLIQNHRPDSPTSTFPSLVSHIVDRTTLVTTFIPVVIQILLQKWTWKTENCSCNHLISNPGHGIQSYEYGYTLSFYGCIFLSYFHWKSWRTNLNSKVNWDGKLPIITILMKIYTSLVLGTSQTLCLNCKFAYIWNVFVKCVSFIPFQKVTNLLWGKIMQFDVQSREGWK